jgi:2-oxoglutarate ferredoxin oxidoreductase subunit beta
VRGHNEVVNFLDVITGQKEITTQYPAGSVQEVRQHDGSILRLRKLADDYDSSSRIAAMSYVQSHYARGEIVTGLLYVEPDASDLHDLLGTNAAPLNALSGKELCPGADALEKINGSLR